MGRARREDSAGEKKEGNDDEDEDNDEEKDEKEKRKRKNKEWRERRSTSNSQVDLTNASAPVPPLPSLLLTELTCPFCQEDMAPPGEIWQCREGHSLCHKCRARPDMQTCLVAWACSWVEIRHWSRWQHWSSHKLVLQRVWSTQAGVLPITMHPLLR